jgi:hypothetical protein
MIHDALALHGVAAGAIWMHVQDVIVIPLLDATAAARGA